MDEPSKAERVQTITLECLYKSEELDDGKPPPDAVLSQGVVKGFGFHPGRLQAKKAEVLQLIKEIVADSFLKRGGQGYSFLELCVDRNGQQWAEHPTMEELFCLAQGLGLAGFCVPRDMWHMFPGGMPYIWFSDSDEEAA